MTSGPELSAGEREGRTGSESPGWAVGWNEAWAESFAPAFLPFFVLFLFSFFDFSFISKPFHNNSK
jgi:hypothetical protein